MNKNYVKEESRKDERQFDGRANYKVDDEIEILLDAHFEKYNISKREIWRNFQIYTRCLFLKTFLAHYELFCKTINLPGDTSNSVYTVAYL